jgi:hypothetical protein
MRARDVVFFCEVLEECRGRVRVLGAMASRVVFLVDVTSVDVALMARRSKGPGLI